MVRKPMIRKLLRGISGLWTLWFLGYAYLLFLNAAILDTGDTDRVLQLPPVDFTGHHTLGTLPPNVLFVEPYHGLGNRLRAYASAAALAKMSGRALVVVWIPDVHSGPDFRTFSRFQNKWSSLTMLSYLH